MNKVLMKLRTMVDPLSKHRFLSELRPGSAVLDVGCGNGSPSAFRMLAPSIHYTGVDIAEFGLTAADRQAADELVFIPSAEFAAGITALGQRFDAVVSAHNIEHTEKPDEVIRAMCSVLRGGGKLYLCFPAAESVKFPSRRGALNFFDDPTHRWLPDIDQMLDIISDSGCSVLTTVRQNQPLIGRILGLCAEPFSRLAGRVLPFTWHYWGFESVVIAEKPL